MPTVYKTAQLPSRREMCRQSYRRLLLVQNRPAQRQHTQKIAINGYELADLWQYKAQPSLLNIHKCIQPHFGKRPTSTTWNWLTTQCYSHIYRSFRPSGSSQYWLQFLVQQLPIRQLLAQMVQCLSAVPRLGYTLWLEYSNALPQLALIERGFPEAQD